MAAACTLVAGLALPGFTVTNRNVPALAPGETSHSNFAMDVNMCDSIVDDIRTPWDDQFLTADAVVYLRTGEVLSRRVAGTECDTVFETPAAILGVVHASRAEWRVGTNVALISDDAEEARLEANTEYLALLVYDSNTQRVRVTATFEVIDGRTGELPFWGTTVDRPIAKTLAALRLAYARNTRYRRYDDLRETPLETLHFRTGWVALGELAAAPGSYIGHELRWEGGPTFEFGDGRDASHTIPKTNDRIRLKEDTPIVIVDYGATGREAQSVTHGGALSRPQGFHRQACRGGTRLHGR